MGTTATAEPSHLVIASLLANPSFTSKEIAKILNISEKTVSTVKGRLKDGLAKQEAAAIELEAYRMLLREQVPAESRVKVLSKVMEQVESNPFSALKAVDMVDDRLGLTPKTMPQSDIEQDRRPMFVLPGDAKVQVNITNNSVVLDTHSNDDK